MYHSHGDSAHTARRAIIHKFHGPHWTTSEEVHSSALEWDEITDLLKEAFPTNRATEPSDALWTNSNPVQHPENHEIFATLHTGANKLILIVHKGVFLPDSNSNNNSSGDWLPEK